MEVTTASTQTQNQLKAFSGGWGALGQSAAASIIMGSFVHVLL